MIKISTPEVKKLTQKRLLNNDKPLILALYKKARQECKSNYNEQTFKKLRDYEILCKLMGIRI